MASHMWGLCDYNKYITNKHFCLMSTRNLIGTPYTGLTEDQRDNLNTRLYDLINSLEYNVDKSDLVDALKTNLMWYEMN